MFVNSNTSPCAVKSLAAVGRDLPVMSNQSWNFSSRFMHSYVNTHLHCFDGGDANHVGLMAASRLEWLLRQSRSELSGKFTEDEMVVLLNCYQGDVFFPDQFYGIAGDVCDDLGYDLDELEDCRFCGLVETLAELTAVQRLTLADALEQTWHIGLKQQKKLPAEFLSSIGIELR